MLIAESSRCYPGCLPPVTLRVDGHDVLWPAQQKLKARKLGRKIGDALLVDTLLCGGHPKELEVALDGSRLCAEAQHYTVGDCAPSKRALFQGRALTRRRCARSCQVELKHSCGGADASAAQMAPP